LLMSFIKMFVQIDRKLISKLAMRPVYYRLRLNQLLS